jgi:hypothetical protein
MDPRVDEEDFRRRLQFAEHVADDTSGFLHGGKGRHAVAEDFPRPTEQFLRSPLLEGDIHLMEVCLSQSRHSSPSAKKGSFEGNLDSRKICRLGKIENGRQAAGRSRSH